MTIWIFLHFLHRYMSQFSISILYFDTSNTNRSALDFIATRLRGRDATRPMRFRGGRDAAEGISDGRSVYIRSNLMRFQSVRPTATNAIFLKPSSCNVNSIFIRGIIEFPQRLLKRYTWRAPAMFNALSDKGWNWIWNGR